MDEFKSGFQSQWPNPALHLNKSQICKNLFIHQNVSFSLIENEVLGKGMLIF